MSVVPRSCVNQEMFNVNVPYVSGVCYEGIAESQNIMAKNIKNRIGLFASHASAQHYTGKKPIILRN